VIPTGTGVEPRSGKVTTAATTRSPVPSLTATTRNLNYVGCVEWVADGQRLSCAGDSDAKRNSQKYLVHWILPLSMTIPNAKGATFVLKRGQRDGKGPVPPILFAAEHDLKNSAASGARPFFVPIMKEPAN
jgi:hypothetical protein